MLSYTWLLTILLKILGRFLAIRAFGVRSRATEDQFWDEGAKLAPLSRCWKWISHPGLWLGYLNLQVILYLKLVGAFLGRVGSFEGRVGAFEGRVEAAEDPVEVAENRVEVAEDCAEAAGSRVGTAKGHVGAPEGRGLKWCGTSEGRYGSLMADLETLRVNWDNNSEYATKLVASTPYRNLPIYQET